VAAADVDCPAAVLAQEVLLYYHLLCGAAAAVPLLCFLLLLALLLTGQHDSELLIFEHMVSIMQSVRCWQIRSGKERRQMYQLLLHRETAVVFYKTTRFLWLTRQSLRELLDAFVSIPI
jgi:hypothetical protein